MFIKVFSILKHFGALLKVFEEFRMFRTLDMTLRMIREPGIAAARYREPLLQTIWSMIWFTSCLAECSKCGPRKTLPQIWRTQHFGNNNILP